MRCAKSYRLTFDVGKGGRCLGMRDFRLCPAGRRSTPRLIATFPRCIGCFFFLGQFYAVALKDTEEYDGDITSVIRVTFHDASHRRLAARYWSFWLSQQANPKAARALDIGNTMILLHAYIIKKKKKNKFDLQGRRSRTNIPKFLPKSA